MEHLITFLQWLHESRHLLSVYRGHDNQAYQLVPSVFRVGKIGITSQQELNRWRSIAGRFASPKPQNEVEWLVLAQHYGIPTGLIDWTTNPLIALFFACISSPDTDGRVIACDRSAFLITNRPENVKVFDKTRDKPLLVDASPMNARTLAQDSMMSLHYGGFPSFAFGDNGAHYIVAAKSKEKILGGLRQFGFTSERLYADLTTAAQQFKKSLAMGKAFEAALSSIDASQVAGSLHAGLAAPGTHIAHSSDKI